MQNVALNPIVVVTQIEHPKPVRTEQKSPTDKQFRRQLRITSRNLLEKKQAPQVVSIAVPAN